MDDWNIAHEFQGAEKSVTPNELIEQFPDDKTAWTVKEEEIIIKADPENGQLFCPKCGSVLVAKFNMRTSHVAMIDETCMDDQILYDHALAEEDMETDLKEIWCEADECHFRAPADCFTINRAEFDARHPAEEWKA